jgi:hypothetical protein
VLKTSISLILAEILLSVTSLAQTVTIFSNFGINNTYDTKDFWQIGGPPGRQPAFATGYAAAFTPSQATTLSTITVALVHYWSANTFTVSLYADALSTNTPSTLLESFQVSDQVGGIGTLVTLTSVVHPFLQAGTRYWIAVSVPNGLQGGGWQSSLTDRSDYWSQQSTFTGSPLWNPGFLLPSGFSRGAFSVTGIPAMLCNPPNSINPVEPSSLTGFVKATTSNFASDPNNAKLADVQIVNNMRWWLEISTMSSPLDAPFPAPTFLPDTTTGSPSVIAAQENLILPCTPTLSTQPPYIICQQSLSSWKASFCGPGSVDLTLQLTAKSVAITFLDLLAPPGLSPSDLPPLAEDIMTEVPDFATAVSCVTSPRDPRGIFSELACVKSSMGALTANTNELLHIPDVMEKYGVMIGIDALRAAIDSALVDLAVLIGDNIALLLEGSGLAIPIDIRGQ